MRIQYKTIRDYVEVFAMRLIQAQTQRISSPLSMPPLLAGTAQASVQHLDCFNG